MHVAAAIAVGSGFGDGRSKSRQQVSAIDSIFRPARLVTLQFPSERDTGIPWQLQVARLLVSFVAVLVTIDLLIGAITRPIRGKLMPYMKGHTVLSGAASDLQPVAARALRKMKTEEAFEAFLRLERFMHGGNFSDDVPRKAWEEGI